jgi:hypothetical protein
MNLKFKEGNKVVPLFDSLMDNDFGVDDKLTLLAFNITKEIYGMSDSFLSFLMKYQEKKLITCFPLC